MKMGDFGELVYILYCHNIFKLKSKGYSMHNGLRDKMGISEDCTLPYSIASSNDLADALKNFLKKYAILVSFKSAGDTSDMQFIGGVFRRGLINKIDKKHSGLYFNNTRIGFKEILDIVPVSDVDLTRHISDHERRSIYTFERHIGDWFEKAKIIHVDPFSAYLTAFPRFKSDSQTLTEITPINLGVLSYFSK